jgi:hypothetical protein
MPTRRCQALLAGFVFSLTGASGLAAESAGSLDEAVQTARRMMAQGRPRAEIAAWVTRTVDERIASLNQDVADERGRLHASGYDVAKESFDAWSNEGVGVDDPFASAHWTWENRVGHCQENAHMAFHLLMMAGESGEEIGELACGDHIYVVWGIPRGFTGEITIAKINSWGNAFIIDPWLGVCKPASQVGRLDLALTKAGFYAINRVATWSFANYLKKYKLWLQSCEDLGGRYGLESDRLVVTAVSGSSRITLGQAQLMKPAGCLEVTVAGPCRVRLVFRGSILEGGANGRIAVLSKVIQGNTVGASLSLVKISSRDCLKVILRSTSGGASITREGILRKL